MAEAAKHAMYCAIIATACADACSGEEMDMRQCIRICLDTADVCTTMSRMAVRQTGEDNKALRAMFHTCIEICEICAAECAKHDHDHCKRCAEMCRECADDCRKALATVSV
jgi:hypothetical protein